MFPGNSYGHMLVSSDGTLRIQGVQKEDAGFLVCSALSVAGSTTARAFLQVSLLMHSLDALKFPSGASPSGNNC